MTWEMSLEDFEHRNRRVKMYKEQKLSHDSISQIFANEEQVQEAQIQQNQEQQRAIEETEIQEETVASKKYEVLQRIDEEIKKLETRYDDAEKLAYYLRKEYFDRIPPNSDNSLLIIATQQGNLWSFKVTALPNPIYDLTKIKRIDILKED